MQAATATAPRRTVSPPRRVEVSSHDNLLLMATSRFCSTKNYDRLSIDQYKDAFYLLIEDVGNAAKQKIARFTTNCTFTPRQIALYLALEPIEISAPVLSRSPTLGQLDLVRIIETTGVDHARIIATRPDIGPNVEKRLRQIEDAEVNEALDKNFALNGKTANSQLSDKVEEEPTKEVVFKQKGLKISVKSSTKTTKAEKKLLEAAARGGKLDQNVVADLGDETSFADSLEQAARSGNRQIIAESIRSETGLTLETAHQVLSDKSGQTLSVLLSAHDVGSHQTNRILMLAYPEIGLSVGRARETIAFYDRLNSASSRKAVDQWPREETTTEKHQPHLHDTDSQRLQRAPVEHKGRTQDTIRQRETG